MGFQGAVGCEGGVEAGGEVDLGWRERAGFEDLRFRPGKRGEC